MSKLSINALKQLFKTGLKPDQSAFWNWMDSFWHKDEKISLSSLDGLQDELDKYASKDYVDNHVGTGGAGIDDAVTALDKTWSSQKISDEIAAIGSGNDGVTPHIGENGNWFIGTTDTGVKAQGNNGDNGVTPHIGENGNWYIGTTDTGVKAQGATGKSTYQSYLDTTTDNPVMTEAQFAAHSVNTIEKMLINGDVEVPISDKTLKIYTDDSVSYQMVGGVLVFSISDKYKKVIKAGL